MAPDVNSVSKTQQASHSHTSVSSAQDSPETSRRTSSVMGPPPVPQNSSLPNSPRPPSGIADTAPYVPTSGPIRHPRPLTAAELHLELEKEQESIVNRLTRELSALRAQTASVASTASSTSDLFTSTQNDPYSSSYSHNISSNIVPTAARRHRSSSNLSSRSSRSTRDTLSSSVAAGATSVSSVAAPRDRDHAGAGGGGNAGSGGYNSQYQSSRPSIDIPRPEISRQNSLSGSMYRSSTATSHPNTGPPSASSPHWAPNSNYNYNYTNPRHSVSSSISTNYPTSSPWTGGGSEIIGNTRSPSASHTSLTTAAQAQARYEEAAMQKAELDAVKRENEALRLRIKELEKSLVEKSSTVGGSPSATRLSPATTATAATAIPSSSGRRAESELDEANEADGGASLVSR